MTPFDFQQKFQKADSQFSNVDIDDFYSYINKQIESEKDLVGEKSEEILNILEFMSEHHVLVN